MKCKLGMMLPFLKTITVMLSAPVTQSKNVGLLLPEEFDTLWHK